VTSQAKERVLDALVSITAERGLDRASIREIAAEAGVSIGTVQYYCRSRDEMLEMGFRYILERMAARVAAARPTSSRGPTAVAPVLRQALHEFLPLDKLRLRECRVYLAFAARAAVMPQLASVQHELLGDMRRRCADVFRAAQANGEAIADFDPNDAAAVTTALVDGLLLHMLTDPTGLRGKAAVALLDQHLGRYLDLTR
jgi:AcrR family transcriptional regulator